MVRHEVEWELVMQTATVGQDVEMLKQCWDKAGKLRALADAYQEGLRSYAMYLLREEE